MLKRRQEAIGVLNAFTQKNGISVIGENPKLIEKTHIITGKFDGTILKFLSVDNKTSIGLQSFSQDMLPANKHFVISAMKLEIAEAVLGSNSIANSNFQPSAPALVRNGEFKLSQDGTGYIIDVLNDVLVNDNAPITNDDRFYNLEVMEVLQAEKKIIAEMTLPASLPTDKDYYVKMTFKGYSPR